MVGDLEGACQAVRQEETSADPSSAGAVVADLGVAVAGSSDPEDQVRRKVQASSSRFVVGALDGPSHLAGAPGRGETSCAAGQVGRVGQVDQVDQVGRGAHSLGMDLCCPDVGSRAGLEPDRLVQEKEEGDQRPRLVAVLHAGQKGPKVSVHAST